MQLRRSWPRFIGLGLVAALTAGLMILAASFLYLAPGLPPAAELRKVELQIPLRIYSRDEHLIGEFGEQRRSPVNYDQLPPLFIDAVLAAEDERFFRHRGVDVIGLTRAFVELVRYRDIRSGGSTITMQVARNFFLSREQRFLRKFNEIVLALQIETLLTKEQILELYLNKIYLGHRAYGAEAAARVYYGKSIEELSLPQWAMIAGLPKAPSAYNPITSPERARARRDWILGRMHHTGAISDEELENARRAPVTARYHGPTPDLEASYFAELVRQEVVERQGTEAYTRGIRVYTTLDGQRQRDAVRALRDGLHAYDERHGWRGPEDQLNILALPPLPGPADGAIAEQHGGEEKELIIDFQAAEQWAEALAEYNVVGKLEPALVAEVHEDHARLVLRDATVVTLPMARLEWARPFINTNVVGDPPESPDDVLDEGDVVRLRPVPDDQGETVWHLAQIPQVQGALVSLDPATGAVRALQGGYSFSASKYNRVTQSRRQAGSAFKPFIYTAALENGLTPATLVNDAPIVFEDEELETAWRPTGAGTRFYGPTRLREALYRSLNLVSIRVLQQVGVRNALKTMERLGLPAERFPGDLSLALGSASVTPLELATAYGVFANGGFRVEPRFIERIENDGGEVLWREPPVLLCDEQCRLAREALPSEEVSEEVSQEDLAESPAGEEGTDPGYAEGQALEFPAAPVLRERVMDARVAWLMDSMLKDVIRRGTGRAARSLGRRDIAGKTGTTNDQVDAWFSGYSPALVATAWVGFDNPASLGAGEYGGRAALPLWINYMDTALRDIPEQELPQPGGIISVRINRETGKRARPGRGDAVFEYFREGNVPPLEEGDTTSREDEGESPEHLF